ncbi:cytochrome P450 [Daedaleopsis nitida]|nr:cytochrome P450 [Daedaleopsis nitida]
MAEGDVHRRQRRVLSPAFGPAQIREFNDVFLEKAAELRDLWMTQVVECGGPLRTNVMDGLRGLTLDIIGLTGFNYQFNALNPGGEPNELNRAFQQIFKRPPNMSILRVVMDMFPMLNIFKPPKPDERVRKVKEGQVIARRIGMQLIQERKKGILNESSYTIEKKDIVGRDILTLLMKANLATDVPDDQRLSDDEVFAQIGSLLAAGHETTNTAVA